MLKNLKLCKTALVFILVICFGLSGCSATPAKTVSGIPIYSSTGTFTLISSFSPENAASYLGGSTVIVSVTSDNPDLTAYAEFNGQKTQLLKEIITDEEQEAQSEHYLYYSSFTMPSVNKDTTVGQIKFSCKHNETEEIYYSGLITVIKASENGDEVYIAEVVGVPAETFNGDTIDDMSAPYNSFLPVGTVDYCSSAAIVNEGLEKSYRLLRFGKRVYDGEGIKVYKGALPSTNTLIVDRCETEGKYTLLSLITDWKAPFTVELKEQEYVNAEKGNFNIKSQAYTYLEIRFMYCNEIIGTVEFEKNNPLFTSGEISYEDNCAVLKLTLKNEGKFYGWRAEYDEYDTLNIRFLEPTRLYTESNSEYGYGLYDKVIIVDAGHGGKDSGGAVNGYTEADSNLVFANLLKRELTAAGAEVIMTRTDNTGLTAAQRRGIIHNYEPDLVISVHRNGGGSNGFGAYYFNPFSADASKYVYAETMKTDLYRKSSGSSWHYFFLNRVGICPSILTENGYLDDEEDRLNMYDADHQTACAKAIVKGVIKYFLSQHP